MKAFFRVLWFLLPILVMMACVYIAFYWLVEFRFLHR